MKWNAEFTSNNAKDGATLDRGKELGKEILSRYPFLAKLVKYSVVIRGL